VPSAPYLRTCGHNDTVFAQVFNGPVAVRALWEPEAKDQQVTPLIAPAGTQMTTKDFLAPAATPKKGTQ
jgi:hypothetical protein